jgi:aspartate/glutamate racemase
VNGIVSGGTEIALLLGETDGSAPDLLDPLELLAEAAVEHAVRPT